MTMMIFVRLNQRSSRRAIGAAHVRIPGALELVRNSGTGGVSA